jgi:hypothetical protein
MMDNVMRAVLPKVSFRAVIRLLMFYVLGNITDCGTEAELSVINAVGQDADFIAFNSLIRSLMSVDNRSLMPEGETTMTDGIDISNWSLNRDGQMLTFSVWDFAGQTVYYNTHQVSDDTVIGYCG